MVAEFLSIGTKKTMTGKQLASAIGCDIRAITAMIEKERREGKPICAANGKNPGYYLAADTEELETYCNSLSNRAREIYKTRKALLKASKRNQPLGIDNREEK